MTLYSEVKHWHFESYYLPFANCHFMEFSLLKFLIRVFLAAQTSHSFGMSKRFEIEIIRNWVSLMMLDELSSATVSWSKLTKTNCKSQMAVPGFEFWSRLHSIVSHALSGFTSKSKCIVWVYIYLTYVQLLAHSNNLSTVAMMGSRSIFIFVTLRSCPIQFKRDIMCVSACSYVISCT